MTKLPVKPPPRTVYLAYAGPISHRNTETLLVSLSSASTTPGTTVHLFLSSTGGNVSAGVAAYELCKGMVREHKLAGLITHNVGTVASAANLLFLAGNRRLATESATFYFHATTGQAGLQSDALQSAIESVQTDDTRGAEIVARETGLPLADVRALLTSSGVTYRTDRARTARMVHDVQDVRIPADAIYFHLVLDHGNVL